MFLQSHLRTSAFPQAYLPSHLSLAWLPTKDAFLPIRSQLPSCGPEAQGSTVGTSRGRAGVRAAVSQGH